MADRPALRRLARRLGILDSFRDFAGAERATADVAREQLAAALGHAAATEEEAESSLRRLEEQAPPVQPFHVARRGRGELGSLELTLPGDEGPAWWTLRATREDGGMEESSGRADLRGGRALVAPDWLAELPDGIHELELSVERGGLRAAARQLRVVAPALPWTADEQLGAGGRAFGVLANLYTLVRAPDAPSEGDDTGGLGRGDLRDLGALVELAARHGARFVGLNPLHAQRAAHAGASPYTPVSRLFRDPAYLDVEAVPELAGADALRARLASPELRGELRRARAAPLVDAAGHRRLHLELCSGLHRVFRERGTPERREAYARYREREGALLERFATFLALDAALATPDGPLPRAAWPAELRTPDSPAVARFAAEHAVDVDLHRWLQFELDRQLGDVAARARALGVDLGLYQDLSVAADREGADDWMFPGLTVHGVSLGAPPDAYSSTGQDWGLAPWNPLRLAEGGAELWARALRAAFRHAGALRVDHALGLVRQFWIPRGRPASEGAYVSFPSEALLAILALESRRARALVVAEDLGTVPDGFRELLGREGLLRSSVLYFERDGRGFCPARAYPAEALATAGTHDHVPLPGFREARDVELRHAAGELDEAQHRDALAARADDVRDLVERLVAEGLLDPADARTGGLAGPRGEERLRVAVHAFLARTPARLVGAALDDLAGERDPVNLPGLGDDRHPCWRRRMARAVAEIDADPVAAACLAALRDGLEEAP